MMRKTKLSWLLDSWAYQKAQRLVSVTIASPEKLLALVGNAQALKVLKHGRFADVLGSVKAAFRLIRCYASGEYRDISLQSFSLIVASVIYFVMPVDSLPDFIIGLGYLDDAALLNWTFKTVAQDIEKFIAWEHQEAEIINADYELIEGESV